MELGFSYRHSEIKALGLTVLGVKLKLLESTKEAVLSEMRRISRQRRDTQPTDMPSLGSVFKRTDGQSAARLIDLAGLKGTRIGGASVSEKHAGFIVNLGGATPQDFKRLVRLIKDEIYKKFGIHLSEEIEYL
jgi:UDP-N-acetylmuramate dehydrogenase